MTTIKVEPLREHRVEFARWLVTVDPSAGMSGTGVFNVRPHLFVEAPEQFLVGALIDGTLYRHVAEEEAAPPEADPEPAPDPEPALICEDCGKLAASPAGLAAHRRAKHEGN